MLSIKSIHEVWWRIASNKVLNINFPSFRGEFPQKKIENKNKGKFKKLGGGYLVRMKISIRQVG